ncbi:MAG: hypothetical protein M1812_006549 [Candelaria pacifica]|nr:MAG: hypothetical protein M1812_006549 [Candelaria pacifica]
MAIIDYDSISNFFQANYSRISLITAASLGLISLTLIASHRSLRARNKLIRSPRTTLLPRITQPDIDNLAYPPDVLPGLRDVETPYGTMRVYEWGPEDGRKVLCVHGISTPCLALGGVAHGLVAKGCRVMLFDLWGRGYSDEPSDLPHDTRLYTSQILLALTSSPLSWTGEGSGGFSIIGYSLGGGIAASFTSYFPDMVNSLVLLAPSGLVRPKHISSTSKFLYSTGIVPESLLQWLVKRRLRGGPLSATPTKDQGGAGLSDAVEEEVPKRSTAAATSASMSKSRPHVDIQEAVVWQLDNHEGFPSAFMSSIRYAPITDQQEDWKRLGQILSAQKGATEKLIKRRSLEKAKVLIIMGSTDPIIVEKELKDDSTEALGGAGNVDFRTISAGHEFAITKSDEVVGHIVDFWSLEVE